MSIFLEIIEKYCLFTIVYFICMNSVYFILLILSTPQVFARTSAIEIEEDQYFNKSKPFPPVSIIVPAYNEKETIEDSVTAMLEKLNYHAYEVIVINDGSKDETMDILLKTFDLYKVPPAFQIKINTQPVKGYYRSRKYSNLLVLDKLNGGKADALNAGINVSKFAYFLALDADTLIAKDALYRTISPMITEKNVMAVGGTIGVVNDSLFQDGQVVEFRFPKTLLAGIQVIEYIRAYLFGKVGWNYLGGNLVISGAFGLYNKELVLENGGYLNGTVGEDMELTLKIHHNQMKKKDPYQIFSIPDTVAWTEVPSTSKVLSAQRERWHRGLIDCLYRHREMFLNPKYGVLGMFTYPFFVFGELLAPIVEFTGWICFLVGAYYGIINFSFFFQFILASIGLSLLLTFSAVFLAQVSMGKFQRKVDFFDLFVHSVFENFGYRQLTVYWRLKGIYKYFRGSKSWGEMTRTGLTKTSINSENLKRDKAKS